MIWKMENEGNYDYCPSNTDINWNETVVIFNKVLGDWNNLEVAGKMKNVDSFFDQKIWAPTQRGRGKCHSLHKVTI